MLLGREYVYGVHSRVRLPPVLYPLDIFPCQRALQSRYCWWHTGDVLVEDIIFLDRIVDNTLGGFVDDQNFPLQLRPRVNQNPSGLKGGDTYITPGDTPDCVNNN